MANDEKNKGNNGAKSRKRGLDSSTLPMELGSDMKKFLSGYADKMKKCDDLEGLKKNVPGGGDRRDVDDKASNATGDVSEKESVVVQGESSNPETGGDASSVSKKRKRDCYSGMLEWMLRVAKNPGDPAIGEIPERGTWESYGADQKWRQALMVRQAVLSQTNVDASSQHSVWQRIKKLHPSMYNDRSGTSGLRTSRRVATAKESSPKAKVATTPGSSSSAYDNNCLAGKYSEAYPEWLEIPIGPDCQAELPEYVGAAEYESDPKWSGTKIWPLAKGEKTRGLIERDPIGKGRQESCGCQFRGSLDCMKFHIREKRNKLKLELGSAFYLWKSDSMGEEVALSWNKQDEAKFEQIVKNNPQSMGKDYWDELFKAFPHKGREALVRYYFNVFLLRRRADQNRNKEAKLTESEDDEPKDEPTADISGHKAGSSPGSSKLRSPKKPPRGRR